MIKTLRQKLEKVFDKKSEGQDAGFMLTELLVVIAIVTILSSVAYAAISGARDKVKDKAIMATMLGIQLRAAALYEKNGCYLTTSSCALVSSVTSVGSYAGFLDRSISKDPDIANALIYVDQQTRFSMSVPIVGFSGDWKRWVVSAPLRSDRTKWFCVDSTRNQRIVSVPLGSFLNYGFNTISLRCRDS